MMLKRIFGITLLLLIGSISWANLYLEEVEVLSRSPAERAVYLANGLNQLVNKITENPKAAEKPEIMKAQTQVLEYVLSYQYINKPDTLNPQNSKLFLKIQFDKKAVESLLRQAKLSVPVTKEVATNVKPTAPLPEVFQLVVDNIEEVNDYKEVVEYLSTFDAISTLQVVEVAPTAVTFDVKVPGGLGQLKQLILLGNVLVPAINTDFEGEITQALPILKYRYQR